MTIAILLLACSNHSGEPVNTKTSTDTMTNVTNPGVGSVADDTSTNDNDTTR